MRRRWRFFLPLLLLVLLLAALPYLAAVGPLRDVTLRLVLPRINGTVTAGSASLGWLSPIRFEQIEIRGPDGTPAVTVAVLQGDRPLWRYLVSPSQLGTFRVDRPLLNVVVGESGWNLKEVFAGGEAQQPPDVAMIVEIADGGLAFRGRGAAEPWSVEGLNLALALVPSTASPSGQTELVLRPGIVFQRTPLTPRMCNDLLKYIVPVLAETTNVSGAFSIEVDEWRLPAADLADGAGTGRLVIHSIDVSPGPLVGVLAALLSLPPTLRLADNSAVPFSLAERRIHHRDLTFGVRELAVRTEGSVGLDQTLDLVAEIRVPPGLLEKFPVLSSLVGQQPFKLPIRGTLSRPQLDAAALGVSNAGNLLGTLQQLLEKRPPEGERLLDRLLDPDRPKPLLDRWRDRPRRGEIDTHVH